MGVFDEEPAAPLSNGTVHALPWEFVATTPVQQQGFARDPRTFTIRGVTIVPRRNGDIPTLCRLGRRVGAVRDLVGTRRV